MGREGEGITFVINHVSYTFENTLCIKYAWVITL